MFALSDAPHDLPEENKLQRAEILRIMIEKRMPPRHGRSILA